MDLVDNQNDLGPCNCELFFANSLPYLARACETGLPIPLSLFHPRWWIKSDVFRGKDWRLRYPEPTDQQLLLSPKRRDIYTAIAGVFQHRDELQPEERARFDDQILRATETLSTAAKQPQQLAALLLGELDLF
jgi:hypothetical protein